MDILKLNSSSVLSLGIFLQITEESNWLSFPVLHLFVSYLDKLILPSFYKSLVNSSFTSLKTIEEVIIIYLFDHPNMKFSSLSIYVNT